jgi:predicted aspartyl protease
MKMIVAVLVAAFALAAAAPPAPAATVSDEAAALLAKHKAFVGWSSGDGVVKTLRATGEAGTTKIRMLRFGVAYRQTSQARSGIETDTGFTGNVFWTSSVNGFTIRPIGDVVRAMIDDQSLFGELTGSYTAAVLRHEAVEGADTVVLRLTHAVAYPMDVYVDPATGAFKRAVIDPGGKYESAVNGIQYTEVQGKRFISAWRRGSSTSVARYDKIEVNPELPADALRPPAQTATWTFGERTAPVELTNKNFPRVYVELTLNGEKGHFILDTGASGIVITDAFARRIGAKQVQHTQIGGIGGSIPANLIRVDTLGVGGSTLHNVVMTSGLREGVDGPDEHVVGLAGFDLLAGAIVELDFDAKTLAVMDPAKVAPDASRGLVLHPDLSTHHIRVPMQLNDKFDVIATLDSGNPINVLFSKDLVYQNRIAFLVDPTQLGSTRLGGGVGANYEIERCGKLTSLKLGPIEYKPVPACDSAYMGRNDVLVGLDFMKAFNFVFDYPDGIVLLMPRKR